MEILPWETVDVGLILRFNYLEIAIMTLMTLEAVMVELRSVFRLDIMTGWFYK